MADRQRTVFVGPRGERRRHEALARHGLQCAADRRAQPADAGTGRGVAQVAFDLGQQAPARLIEVRAERRAVRQRQRGQSGSESREEPPPFRHGSYWRGAACTGSTQ